MDGSVHLQQVWAAMKTIRRYWRFWIKDVFVRHRQDRKSIDIRFAANMGWCELTYLWWMIADRKVQSALDMKVSVHDTIFATPLLVYRVWRKTTILDPSTLLAQYHRI